MIFDLYEIKLSQSIQYTLQKVAHVLVFFMFKLTASISLNKNIHS